MAEVARFAHHMSDEDALMWNIEKDPILRSTILAVAIFDSVPDWDRLRERIERTSLLIPRFRQRVVSPPFRIGPPRWTVEPTFDLDFHLRRTAAPRAGKSPHAARRAAADRDDELRPGPPAVGVHALRRARRRRRRARRDRDEGAPLGHRRRRRHGAAHPSRRSRRATRPTRPTIELPAAPGARIIRHRRARCASRSRTPAGASLGIARRIPGTTIARRDRTRCAIRSASATDLARTTRSIAAHARAGDVADVAGDASTAASVGGSTLRRRARRPAPRRQGRRGQPQRRRSSPRSSAASAATTSATATRPEALRMTLPINLRQGGDDAGGNRFAPARFPVPVDIDDPRERVHAIGVARAQLARRAGAADDEHARRHR